MNAQQAKQIGLAQVNKQRRAALKTFDPEKVHWLVDVIILFKFYDDGGTQFVVVPRNEPRDDIPRQAGNGFIPVGVLSAAKHEGEIVIGLRYGPPHKPGFPPEVEKALHYEITGYFNALSVASQEAATGVELTDKMERGFAVAGKPLTPQLRAAIKEAGQSLKECLEDSEQEVV